MRTEITDEALKLLEAPNAGECVWAYLKNQIESGRWEDIYFCEEFMLKILDIPNAKEIVSLYATKWFLSEEAQKKIFDMPNGKEIMLEYIKYHHLYESNPWGSEFPLKMLFKRLDWFEVALEYVKRWPFMSVPCYIVNHPKAGQLVLEYVKSGGYFYSNWIEKYLFSFSNSGEIVLEFIKHYRLPGYKYYKQLFYLPNADEIMLELAKRDGSLPLLYYDQIYNLPNASEVVLAYVKNPKLTWPPVITSRMFDLPDAREIIMECIKLGGLGFSGAEEKIFALPNAGDIFMEAARQGHYLNTKYFSRTLELPNGEKIILEFDKHHPVARNLIAWVNKMWIDEETALRIKHLLKN